MTLLEDGWVPAAEAGVAALLGLSLATARIADYEPPPPVVAATARAWPTAHLPSILVYQRLVLDCRPLSAPFAIAGLACQAASSSVVVAWRVKKGQEVRRPEKKRLAVDLAGASALRAAAELLRIVHKTRQSPSLADADPSADPLAELCVLQFPSRLIVCSPARCGALSATW